MFFNLKPKSKILVQTTNIKFKPQLSPHSRKLLISKNKEVHLKNKQLLNQQVNRKFTKNIESNFNNIYSKNSFQRTYL